MSTLFLTTKLYIPPIRPDPSTGPLTELTSSEAERLKAGLTATSTRGGRTRLVSRPRLIERLNAELECS